LTLWGFRREFTAFCLVIEEYSRDLTRKTRNWDFPVEQNGECPLCSSGVKIIFSGQKSGVVVLNK